jgi:hypothetical protein
MKVVLGRRLAEAHCGVSPGHFRNARRMPC